MPGCSLWLLPPAHDPAYNVLSCLIRDEIPKYLSDRYGKPVPAFPGFAPHVTITSGLVGRDGAAWQAWLDAFDLSSSQQVQPGDERKDAQKATDIEPACAVNVQFQQLETRDKWNMKLIMAVHKTKELQQLARSVGLDEQRLNEWYPHVSLAYNDDIKIGSEELDHIARLVARAGVSLTRGTGMSGWTHGSLAVVETFRKIEEWKIVASRTLE